LNTPFLLTYSSMPALSSKAVFSSSPCILYLNVASSGFKWPTYCPAAKKASNIELEYKVLICKKCKHAIRGLETHLEDAYRLK
jgi:hypothetical protein